jgi:hypothetical protein
LADATERGTMASKNDDDCDQKSEFRQIETTLRGISKHLEKQRRNVADDALKVRLDLKIKKISELTKMTADVRLFTFKGNGG